MKKTKLAIFDIDGTIFRSSLLIELFNELVLRGVFPKRAQAQVQRDHAAWLDRKGHYNDYLMKLVRVHYRYQAGQPVAAIEAAVRAVISSQKDRVYRYTRDLIGTLKKQNYYLLAISNSQDSIVKRFAKKLGFTAAIGRVPEVVQGKYTGRTVINGKVTATTAHLDKVEMLEDFIKEQSLRVDHTESIMVGDTEGDVSLLAHVGHPIAFNPSSELARIAKTRGWQIVVERKDVVYRIKDTDLLPVKDRQKVRIRYGTKNK